ncbi:MAG: T9SS type A sorting domain-containing protein, partial [Bacteroidetes bacterium]|nr:T9SS type A sorting domain-containing protein [Bacteroidota bacterium]
LLDAGNPGDTYLWSDASTDQTLTAFSTGTYSVVVTDANGCTGSDAADITINTPPTVNLGADVTQCGGTVLLDDGNPGPFYHLWNTGATTQTIIVTTTGTYSVVVTDANGCTGSDEADVTINSAPVISAGSDVTICGGSTNLTASGGVSYVWSTGATTAGITVSPSGTTTYTVTGTDANGCSASDMVTVTIFAPAGQLPPLVEGLENPPFPPAGWALNNPDGSITWERTDTAAKTGTYSMHVDNYDYPANGQVDELTTPSMDLSSATGPALTFQVAYQLYTDPSSSPNYSDTLMIQISTDCGATWTTAYNKYGVALTTATPTFSSNKFIPTASQWRMETVPLPIAGNVLVKFRHTTDYENEMYVDDINISGLVSTEERNLANVVTVFPNPSSGDVFVKVNALDLGNVEVKIYNLLGEVISETAENISAPKKLHFNLSSQPGSIYFVEVNSVNAKTVKKIILNK